MCVVRVSNHFVVGAIVLIGVCYLIQNLVHGEESTSDPGIKHDQLCPVGQVILH